MEQSLAKLVLSRVITREIALGCSSRPDQLEGLLDRAGYEAPGSRNARRLEDHGILR